MPRTALYTGTFDPVTNGHLDVVRHACRLVDRLVIAIGVHSSKAPVFTPEERAEMGVSDGLVRLSVGLEHADDLVADLRQALERA